jgi:hypothetical protein
LANLLVGRRQASRLLQLHHQTPSHVATATSSRLSATSSSSSRHRQQQGVVTAL